MELTKFNMIESIDASVNALMKVRIIKGNKIQATVMSSYLRKFQKFLVEKSSIIIGKPVIGDNVAKNPILQHNHRLFFNFETEVSKCENFVGSVTGISIVAFDVLQSNRIPTETTVDIIGYVYTFFPKEDHKCENGKTVKKLNLQIRDLESRSMFVTLWEAHANKMEAYLENKEEGVSAVMLLQFGKYLYSGGRAYVHTQYNATNLFINNDEIEEVMDFKNSLIQIESSDSTSSRQLVASQYASNNLDEFLSKTDFNTVEQVNKLAEVKSVIVMGTVISFAPGSKWYYAACKTCNKKLTTNMEDINNEMICPTENCNKKTIFCIPRFMIPLRVQDSTGVVSLTLFERDAKKLFNKSAKEFVDTIMDGDTADMPTSKINEANLMIMPNEITELVGRKFAFKIDITSFNVDNNYKSFTVKKLTEDPEIIAKLEAKFDAEQTPNSSLLKTADYGSQETISKDTLSCSADNDTPLALMDSTVPNKLPNKTAKISPNSDLKRNLVVLYDDDDDAPPGFEAATKKRHQLNEGPKDNHGETLLIPKKEK